MNNDNKPMQMVNTPNNTSDFTYRGVKVEVLKAKSWDEDVYYAKSYIDGRCLFVTDSGSYEDTMAEARREVDELLAKWQDALQNPMKL
jgi:hypothetical protein